MSANDRGPEVPPTERAHQPGASDWWIYRGAGRPQHDIHLLPEPQPWREFRGQPPDEPQAPPEDDFEAERRLGAEFHLTEQNVGLHEVDMVNAALFLRRRLIVTGRPESGKFALAYRIARELRLGRVLRWSITSRTTLQVGLYKCDAIGRAHAATTRYATARRSNGFGGVGGDFIRLSPRRTAFLSFRTRQALLIDELDKSDADLPNDLLSIFEDAEFPIPELVGVRARTPTASLFTNDPYGEAVVVDGRIACAAFPVIVITSNGEREFPAAFLRRRLRFDMREPNTNQLAAIRTNLRSGDLTGNTPVVGELLSEGLRSDTVRVACLIDDDLRRRNPTVRNFRKVLTYLDNISNPEPTAETRPYLHVQEAVFRALSGKCAPRVVRLLNKLRRPDPRSPRASQPRRQYDHSAGIRSPSVSVQEEPNMADCSDLCSEEVQSL